MGILTEELERLSGGKRPQHLSGNLAAAVPLVTLLSRRQGAARAGDQAPMVAEDEFFDRVDNLFAQA